MQFFLMFTVLISSFLFADSMPKVAVGADVFFGEKRDQEMLKNKNVGLISNQTAVGQGFQTTLSRMMAPSNSYKLVAVFAPEHGYFGDAYADETVTDQTIEGVPVYGLHAKCCRRPTAEMLQNVDILIYDIQDIGSRSYTYLATLFYCMEEAKAKGIKMIVLDRPNPMGGEIVDGFLVDEKWRSVFGYVNVPYCYGMTVGELALLYNEENNIHCDLTVISMKGWKRKMTFNETGLSWIPTSPQIPESDTSFFYPTTGVIGQLSLVNIGIGYTLPFKLIGAPWINGEEFAAKLNAQNLPGVHFKPFYFRPFFGKFKGERCEGVQIILSDPHVLLPITTQYTIAGVIKNLYPTKFSEAMALLKLSRSKKEIFHKLNGKEKIFDILVEEKYFIWTMRTMLQADREAFLPVRSKYLISSYS